MGKLVVFNVPSAHSQELPAGSLIWPAMILSAVRVVFQLANPIPDFSGCRANDAGQTPTFISCKACYQW
jgi:hypothetical protein